MRWHHPFRSWSCFSYTSSAALKHSRSSSGATFAASKTSVLWAWRPSTQVSQTLLAIDSLSGDVLVHFLSQAMLTLFRALIGDFDVEAMMKVDNLVGPLLFISFIILGGLFLLNVFMWV
jgi:hypothetical protein